MCYFPSEPVKVMTTHETEDVTNAEYASFYRFLSGDAENISA